MDFNFLASANRITSTYLNKEPVENAISSSPVIDDELKRKFGEAFEEAYDSMIATKAVNSSMRQSYEMAHQDDFRMHASRLGYSIDNRVIEMLNVQLTDDMNDRVSFAMNSAMESIL
ncbi:hypothetical protein [Butyrivibrio sp. FCS014]|uniref:hypothetical protein n=1 Tax=Butyrivibrio sp. FCS014 TaxID=1408304 RepID=UPI00046549D7|nr:hypothetical protein [Butyrivibrio sp. FCS014]